MDNAPLKGIASGRKSLSLDWDAHHEAIKVLYLEEDRTLGEVMTLMEERHNFKASLRQYRKHIGKWVLDKSRRVQVASEIEDRKRLGKESVQKSVVYVRGSLVPHQRIERYMSHILGNEGHEKPYKTFSTPPLSASGDDILSDDGSQLPTLELSKPARNPKFTNVPSHDYRWDSNETSGLTHHKESFTPLVPGTPWSNNARIGENDNFLHTFSSYQPAYNENGEKLDTFVGTDKLRAASISSFNRSHGPFFGTGVDGIDDPKDLQSGEPQHECYAECSMHPFQNQSLPNPQSGAQSPVGIYCCPEGQCPRSEIGKGFALKKDWSIHALEHLAIFDCPFCLVQGRKYPKINEFIMHMNSKHPAEDLGDVALQAFFPESRRGRPPKMVSLGINQQSVLTELPPTQEHSKTSSSADGNINKSSSLPSLQNMFGDINQIPDSKARKTCFALPPLYPSSRDPAVTEQGSSPKFLQPSQNYEYASASSYWTLHEMSDFSILLRHFGSDWDGIAKFLTPKTYIMVKSFYLRSVATGCYRDWLDAVNEADEKKQRGEPTGPLPPVPQIQIKRRYEPSPVLEASTKKKVLLEQELQTNYPRVTVSEARGTSFNTIGKMEPPQYTQTDSGYASIGLKQESHATQMAEGWDDSRTVFTDNQDLEIEEDVKQRLSLAISNDLIGYFKSSIQDNEYKSIRGPLADSLKDFAMKLRQNASPGQQKDATVFVRHYRHRIASLLEDSMKVLSLNDGGEELLETDEQTEVEDEEGIPKQQGLSVAEKMSMWNNSDISKTAEKHLEVPDEAENEEHDDYAVDQFPDAWKFLTESNAYKWLIGKIKSHITLTDSKDTSSQRIQDEIERGLNSEAIDAKYAKTVRKATFMISWPLHKFLKEEYPEEEGLELSSIITITGSCLNAQALSCSEYMRQVWPTTGTETLAILQAAVAEKKEKKSTWVTTDGSQISLTFNNSIVIAVVKGTQPAVTEIGQQFAWLGAALRSSCSKSRLALSTPNIAHVSSAHGSPTFDITYQVTGTKATEIPQLVNGMCWQDLFYSPVIVQGFPILARTQEEQGLEIPLNMMSGLGQASRATNFDGGIVIKGFSTMFCPTKRVKNSILWHYLYEKDGSRISYLAADERCPSRMRIDSVDTACLRSSRNFLGWASSVEIHTGTKDVKYDDIEWPKPNFASAGIALEKASIIVGEYFSGGASFTKGNKDTPLYLRREGPYEQEIHAAGNMKVVIYDTRDRRAWLVDGAMALLHLTRTQLSSTPYSDSPHYTLSQFNHPSPTGGVNGAKKALLNSQNRDILVFQDTETYTETKIGAGGVQEKKLRTTTKDWAYQDLVRQAYHKLEQIHDYENKALTSSSVNLRFTDRDKLTGFAFMDIVDTQSVIRPHVALLKPSGKGWIDFTRSIRAITLLGRGFGELIKPARDANSLCTHWRGVPTGKDYLVACTATLKDICRKYGDHESKPMELSTGVFWHKPDKLFEPCACKLSKISRPCDRVQILLPPSLGSKRHPQPFGHLKGAVIFGRSKRRPWSWGNKGDPVEGVDEESESESEESVEFCDSGIGDSNPPSADDAVSETVDSFPSSSSDGVPSVEIEDLTMSGSLGDAGGTPLSSVGLSSNVSVSDILLISRSLEDGDGELPNAREEGEMSIPLRNVSQSGNDDMVLDIVHDDTVKTRSTKRTWGERVKEKAPQFLSTKRSRRI